MQTIIMQILLIMVKMTKIQKKITLKKLTEINSFK